MVINLNLLKVGIHPKIMQDLSKAFLFFERLGFRKVRPEFKPFKGKRNLWKIGVPEKFALSLNLSKVNATF